MATCKKGFLLDNNNPFERPCIRHVMVDVGLQRKTGHTLVFIPGYGWTNTSGYLVKSFGPDYEWKGWEGGFYTDLWKDPLWAWCHMHRHPQFVFSHRQYKEDGSYTLFAG
jgi:hypothetical protein